jgi:adenosylhomocysteinase
VAVTRRFDVVDLALAAAGRARIEEAERELRVLGAVRAELAASHALAGFRVSVRCAVTAPGAALARALRAAGADVLVCGRGTAVEDEVAAALVEDDGIPTFARSDAGGEAQHAHLDAAVDHKPHLVVDDGAELIGLLHTARREQLGEVVAAAEASAAGLVRLRALELAFPVLALAESAVVRLALERQGLGRRAVDALLEPRDLGLAGRRVVVAGYGPAGAAAAAHARSLGAVVQVWEEEPLLAVEARLDGFELVDGAGEADAVVRPDRAYAEPAAIDLALALEALAVAEAVRRGAALGAGVHAVPEELDERVARLALEEPSP